MLKIYPLFSGSSGNMYLISSHKANILVDIGVSFRSLETSLMSLQLKLEDIDALFLTHEHTDHIKGLETFIKKTNIKIYSSAGTNLFLKEKFSSKNLGIINFKNVFQDKKIKIKDMAITPFNISHDAIEPFGYYIANDNSSVSIATDLGYVSDNIYNYLEKSDLSVIEANYDLELLKYSPYHYNLKERIKSETGHLSNEDSASTILRLATIGKRNFILGHISDNNNSPDIAYSYICSCLQSEKYDLKDFNINIATRDFSNEVYIV